MKIVNKPALRKEVRNFIQSNKKDKLATTTASLSFAVNTFQLANAITNMDTELVLLAGAVEPFVRDVCVYDHNVAIQKATQLAKKLKRRGFSPEERYFVVNKYLATEGNLIYTNLFRLTQKNELKDIANGEEIESSFKSLIPKYWAKMFNPNKDKKKK